ncbi:hypothetical protein CMQ_7631 [Grosmannia clavigera kw1407]|uniref:Uncharacterized protein n=1 Tax=Grosmannia clavigera (strain kw1407 / UAMH 11150) TaxID=655863 RepID=F0XP58_GROCL|nr:uncharacterized protein CMQ_7631 [Grosmannia clavigera kw1407]EFX00629.1 hypothetical protein CMQ_7631 [Grosmannia clavigera kw1407]
MNRFRTKKKTKEESSAAARASSEEPQPQSSSFKGFRKNKKTPEEEKKEDFSLENALPSSDNFRTSLLMTGLSARFSMLREQDDPNTKIGKASDDSVLYPKRQSRTLDGNFRGLDDIAEVQSIRAPPFMRAESFISDTDSNNGSVMNRNRPGEGNVLFGGRQKIYRIPVGSSKAGSGGGMGGRALYDDDVALSAFQKFKQREKDRLALLDFDDSKDEATDPGETSATLPTSDAYDSSPVPRSDSPSPVGYGLRRESSSATSSAARNSTAATSVISQATTSGKDGPQSTAQTGTNAATRTRRLYEQGFNQDMHEHQSSALHRMDTLTGKRSLGRGTPDLAQSPSPTGFGFSGTLNYSNSARQILSKGSAPNLRSTSSPTAATSTIPPNSTTPLDSPDMRSLSGSAESRSRSPGIPPLSPPISDSGDQLHLAIQPNDRGKATAMGVFQKPTLPYDESRFAQRQLQLQQGRESPSEPFRSESNASRSTGISSRSSSVAHHGDQRNSQVPAAPGVTPVLGPLGPSVKERAKSFLFDADDENLRSARLALKQSGAHVPIPISVQRPSDQDHPAFRQPAMPAVASTTAAVEESVDIAGRDIVVSAPAENAAEDSPTLGPGTGLSGLVRQHLRTTSNASSVYSTLAPQSNNYDPSGADDQTGSGGSREWNGASHRGANPFPAPTSPVPPTPQAEAKEQDKKDDEDDFANQLANARRRVQERLTTYAEADGSHVSSPLLAPTEPAGVPLPSAKSNPLGILRGKSSRGSLMERTREASHPKTLKLLGLGAATMSTTPSPSRQSFDEIPSPPSSARLPPAAVATFASDMDDRRPRKESSEFSSAPVPSGDTSTNAEEGEGTTAAPTADEASVHPGLLAFRNARRQLQKQKEAETAGRHSEDGATEASAGFSSSKQSPPQERRVLHSSQDQKAPPIYYTERNRSGSETSNGGDMRTRPIPPRLRAPVAAMDSHQQGGQHLGAPRSAGAARSPGLPGTDIRHSPHMPPQTYTGGPIQKSPMGAPSSPYYPGSGTDSPGASGMTTPTTAGSRMLRAAPQPSGNETKRKVVKKSEISEPTFLGSTGRVPTMSLPQSASAPEINGGSRSRSGSRTRAGSNAAPAGFAPPLPPINPLRKQSDSRKQGGLGVFMRRRGWDEGSAEMSSASTSQLPFEASASGNVSGGPSQQYGSSSDEENNMAPQRPLRKQASDASVKHYRTVEAGAPPLRMDLPGGMI